MKNNFPIPFKEEKKFSAKVVKGEGRGEKLGFPTINLDNVLLDIDYGIYLVEIEVANQKYLGLMHFGPKETFSGIISTEIFLRDHIENLTSENINVFVKAKTREIIKFASADELISQIKKDVENFL